MLSNLAVSIVAAAVLLLPASAVEDNGKRLEALQANGPNASVTVFPVLIGRQTFPLAGEILAMFLERGGMQNLEVASSVFQAEPGSLTESAEAFGNFVRQNSIQTGYALYGEFLVAPGTGFYEVRGILVDREGKLVWSDRQTAADEEFKKVKPGEPMECMMVLVNRLRGPLGLQDPFRPDAPEGKIARRWAARTGMPTEGERAAMKKAQDVARARFAGSRVAVFSILTGRGSQTDRGQAARLAGLLSKNNFGKAEVAADGPAFEGDPGPNEQKRLWDMARAFREHVRRAPPASDYALYAEYGIDAANGRAFFVHFVVCDAAGEWVIVDFQNEHHPDFQSVAPKSADDCDRLVIKRMASYLR